MNDNWSQVITASNNFQQITHNTSFSVSTWVKLTNNNTNFIFAWGNNSSGASVGLNVKSTGKIQNYTWAGANFCILS